MDRKQRAGRNRTITLTDEERESLRNHLVFLPVAEEANLMDKIICADMFEAMPYTPQT